MPYIAYQDRGKFRHIITSVLGMIVEGSEALYIKGEYFGYFVNRMVRKFEGTSDFTSPAFNSSFFDQSKLKTLANCADSASVLINKGDPLAAAGEMNYVISAIYWGLLGQSSLASVSPASYGLRAYLRGILEKIRCSLDTVNTGSQRDATMAFRRHLVIRGVLDDVVDEAYRRHTAVYEDEKIAQNQDIWLDGKLVAPEEN